MTRGFMTIARCQAFARRRVAAEGVVYHVVSRRLHDAPLQVLDEHELFARANTLGPASILSSADPFDDAESGQA